MPSAPIRVCFVCSGNICRSPTAEAVLTRLAEDAGLDGLVVADSAGTGDWHVGQDMDDRSRAILERAGYRPGTHAAKQFGRDEFAARDLVVALDDGHRRELVRLASRTPDPDQARAKILMLRAFDPRTPADADDADLSIGDPYFDGPSGFATVLDQVERGCAGLLAALQRTAWTGGPVRGESVRRSVADQQAGRPPL